MTVTNVQPPFEMIQAASVLAVVHPQPSIYETIVVDGPDGEITHRDVEDIINRDSTHAAFMNEQVFKRPSVLSGDNEISVGFVAWATWQKHRDPLNDDPKEAAKTRARIERERRGPGIARRPRAARKSAPSADKDT